MVVVLAIALSTGCGGDGPSTSPTTVAPPQPTFVNMIGGWVGTYSTNVNVPNIPSLNQSGNCSLNLTITAQTAGQFSGSFQLTNGTVACASSGTITGTITALGTVTSLAGVTTVGALPTGCSAQSTSGYSGVVSPTSLNATATERVSCSAGGASIVADAFRVIALTKR